MEALFDIYINNFEMRSQLETRSLPPHDQIELRVSLTPHCAAVLFSSSSFVHPPHSPSVDLSAPAVEGYIFKKAKGL